MTNSPVLYHHSRNALTVRDILSFTYRRAVAAAVVALLLAAGLSVTPAALAQEAAATAAPVAAAAKVNINTADAQTLAANLKGVGESRAAEIVRYRESFGAFDSVEELVEVKGIGSSTLDMNRDVIILE
ncbi:MAG: ComEA family DNA-binding protein [Halioglobus sp.]|nr:ComEA family DNA-binding protein [Halioglobus sp.]